MNKYIQESEKTLRYIFERYVEGIGSSTIEKELTAKSIKTPYVIISL